MAEGCLELPAKLEATAGEAWNFRAHRQRRPLSPWVWRKSAWAETSQEEEARIMQLAGLAQGVGFNMLVREDW